MKITLRCTQELGWKESMSPCSPKRPSRHLDSRKNAICTCRPGLIPSWQRKQGATNQNIRKEQHPQYWSVCRTHLRRALISRHQQLSSEHWDIHSWNQFLKRTPKKRETAKINLTIKSNNKTKSKG